MSDKPLDKFEQKLVDSYKNYELPYSEAGWTGVSRRLLRKRLLTSLTFWAFSSIVLIGFITGLFFFFQRNQNATGNAGHSTTSGIALNNSDSSTNSASDYSNSSREGTNASTASDSNSSANTEGKTNSTLERIKNQLTTAQLNASNNASGNASNSSAGNSSNSTNANNSNNNSSTSTVEAPKSNELTIQPSIRTGCAGTEIEFASVNSPKDGSYIWNFGDGSFSLDANPKHVYKLSGTFDVSLSITNPKTGQISTTEMHDLIRINPAPAADFDWRFTNTPMGEPCAKFVNTSSDANSYTWHFGTTTSTEISPEIIYGQKGKQHVKLTVTNEYGCFDETVKYVQINNDFNLGADDHVSVKGFKFMPEALKKGTNKFKMVIYDGQNIVFETTKKEKAWTGECLNGKKAAPGEKYAWIVLIYGEDGASAPRYYSGNLTIVP